jgi:hypothetical protein
MTKKKKNDPPWFHRLARTVGLKNRIMEILGEWPTDGSSDSDQTMDVADAFESWERDIGALHE